MSNELPPPPHSSSRFDRLGNGKSDDPAHRRNLTIASAEGLSFVEFDTIVALEAAGSYTWVHCQCGSKHLLSRNLRKIELELPLSKFHRCHRAYVLNLHKVYKLVGQGGYRAIMVGGSNVAVSRRNWRGLREAMRHI